MALLHQLYGECGFKGDNIGRKAINFEEQEAQERRLAEQEAIMQKMIIKQKEKEKLKNGPNQHGTNMTINPSQELQLKNQNSSKV